MPPVKWGMRCSQFAEFVSGLQQDEVLGGGDEGSGLYEPLCHEWRPADQLDPAGLDVALP